MTFSKRLKAGLLAVPTALTITSQMPGNCADGADADSVSSYGHFRLLQGSATELEGHAAIDNDLIESREDKVKAISDFDEKFVKDMAKYNKGKTPFVYDDFITVNEFMGNPILICLGTGTESMVNIDDLTSSLKGTLGDLADIKEKLGKFVTDGSDVDQVVTGKEGLKDCAVDTVAVNQAARGLSQCLDAQGGSATAQTADKDAANTGTAEKTLSPTVKYLLVFNYNIPPVANGLFHHNYRAVRLCANIFMRPEPTNGKDDAKKSVTSRGYAPLDVISIYPTSSVLNAEVTNSRSLQLQGQPSWAGASAGSITYKTQTDTKYQKTLPTVVGWGAPDGQLQWIYYPAKSQEIAYGNKTAFATFLVPADLAKNTGLQMDVSLEYTFKGWEHLYGSVKRMKRLYINTDDAVQGRQRIDMFRRLYGRSLSVVDQMQLERMLSVKDPANIFNTADDAKKAAAKDDTKKDEPKKDETKKGK